MTFESFIANSRAIIERFPNEQVWHQGGLTANRQLQSPEAGYCIVVRYDEKTTRALSRFMKKVYAVLPPVVEYNVGRFHTTIGVYGKGTLKGFAPDRSVLKTLVRSVETGIRNGAGKPEVTFEKWVFNQRSHPGGWLSQSRPLAPVE